MGYCVGTELSPKGLVKRGGQGDEEIYGSHGSGGDARIAGFAGDEAMVGNSPTPRLSPPRILNDVSLTQ